MKTVGLLETGMPPAALAPVHGSYPRMVERFLGDRYLCRTFNVVNDGLPGADNLCDAYVILGSSADAFANEAWIRNLKSFLVDMRGKVPLVGLCFGHQVMAEAFGGRVARSDKGWGIGLHTYVVASKRPWMDEADVFSLAAYHRDQIVEKPPAAAVVASSYFCPFATLEYEDGAAISFQAHPEFEPEYASSLIQTDGAARYKADLAQVALESLAQPNDNARVRGWIRNFLANRL